MTWQNRRASTFLAATALLALASNSASPNDELPPVKSATISADSKILSRIPLPGMGVGSTIDTVDGKPIGAGTRKVSIEPGTHTISLTCVAIGATNTEEVEFNVVAGADYQATALIGGRQPVPCTSVVRRKLESGELQLVPVAYKVDSEGFYFAKPQGIAVRAPKECIPDVAIYNHNRSVEFVTNQPNWIANGQYTVQLTKIPKSVTSDASFLKKVAPDAKDYLEERPRDRLSLVTKEAGRYEVNGQAGYRIFAISEANVAFIATFVLQRSSITIASLTYPLRPGVDAKSALPWSCYDKFVESVKQTQ
jgi:hypothetical protein